MRPIAVDATKVSHMRHFCGAAPGALFVIEARLKPGPVSA